MSFSEHTYIKDIRTKDVPSSNVVNLSDGLLSDGTPDLTYDAPRLARIRGSLEQHPEFARVTAWSTRGLETGKLTFPDIDPDDLDTVDPDKGGLSDDSGYLP